LDALFQLGVGFADALYDGTITYEQKHNSRNIKLGDWWDTFTYLNTEIKWVNYINQQYDWIILSLITDKLVPIYKTQTESEVKISPKLNFIFAK
jgi:hypothetical protein